MQALQELGLTNLQAMQLGVTDPASIQTARPTIGAQTPVLDVLVNNAGISGGFAQSTLDTTLAQFRTVLETNLFGVAGVTQTFFDLLHHSPQPRIVIVSTAIASLTFYADSANTNVRWLSVYQASRTALNMCTLNLAHESRDTPSIVDAVCPGYTQTNFTGHQGTSTAEQVGQRLAKYALLSPDGPTGT